MRPTVRTAAHDYQAVRSSVCFSLVCVSEAKRAQHLSLLLPISVSLITAPYTINTPGGSLSSKITPHAEQ